MRAILSAIIQNRWILIPAVLTILFGTYGIAFRFGEWYQQSKSPDFSVLAINTLETGNTYEVTDYLGGDIANLKLTLGLEVRPKYYGDPLGEVQVEVKDKNNKVVARNSWTSLSKDSGPLQIPFDRNTLVSAVDAQVPFQDEGDSYNPPVTDFPIKISKISDPDHPLFLGKLQVLNTPWYHFSRASPNILWADHQTVDISVKGENLGAPSEFMILAEIYGITDTNGKPMAPWPKLDWITQVIGRVERSKEFAAHVALPTNRTKFEPGKCYAIKTFVIKEQNYADPRNADKSVAWKDWEDAWRFGDSEDLALVCFPVPQAVSGS